jgi:O-antigen ligase
MILGALPGDPQTVALGLGLLGLGPLIYVGWRRPVILVVLLLLAVSVPLEISVSRPVEGTIAIADLASFGLIALVGIRTLLRPGRSVPPLLATLLACGLIASALSAYFAADGLAGLAGLVRFAQMMVFVPLATYLAIESRDDQRLFLAALIVLGLIESVVAIQQYATGTGAGFAAPGAGESETVRAYGTFDASNIMALPIIVTAALLAAFATALWTEGRTRILALIALIPLTAGLLASLSRGAWVAALVGIVLIGLYRNHRLTLAASAAAAILFVAVGQLGGDDPESDAVITGRATSLAETPANPDQSVVNRYGLWQAAIEIWREEPAVGAGFRGFVERRDLHRPLNASSRGDVSDPGQGFRRIELESPHNLFLLVLSEQGLIGLIAYGLLLGAILIYGLKRAAPGRAGSGAGDYRPFQLALIAWFASFLVRSFYGDIGGPTIVLEGLLIGAAMSVAFQLRERAG